MNIKITYNWLLEFLETDATPFELQKYLCMCGPSIEKIEQVDNDYVFEIEITSNRVDTASVYGIGREASAILPQFGKLAKLKEMDLIKEEKASNRLPLAVSDTRHLCNRIIAVVMDNVQVGQLPEFMQNRLEECQVRSLNNLIDITNYVMLELGQPTHVFDYDRIKTNKLVVRKAKNGEEFVSLDGKVCELNQDDVIIDDGSGRVIDLPGIMGAENSVVTSQTKRIVFFIESNNPTVIRRTSMRLALRTMAATLNEKGPDPELPKTALLRGIDLYQKYAGAKVASKIHDLYPKKYLAKKVSVSVSNVNKIVGIKIAKNEIVKILENLGFKNSNIKGNEEMVTVTVPSFRSRDVSIKEDLVEEITRIYGYNKLPNLVQSASYIKQPKDVEFLYELQSKVKHFLKNLGLHEVVNYSMISKEMIENSNLSVSDHLVLKNSISKDFEYMRAHLMPSLLKNVKENEGKTNVVKFFEIAKTYKEKKGDLPEEKYKLGIVTNSSYFDLKGIVDALLRELNINSYQILKSEHPLLLSNVQGKIVKNNEWLGEFGQLKDYYQLKNQIKSKVYLAVFDFERLINFAKDLSNYKPINPYATVKLDLNIELKPQITYFEIKEKAFKISKLLRNIEVVDTFKNKITIRFYFASTVRNIKEEEAKNELQLIKDTIQ